MKTCIYFFLILSQILLGNEEPSSTSAHRQAQLARIHPTSLQDLLRFATVYPDSPEGISARKQAFAILSGQSNSETPLIPCDFEKIASSLASLVEPRLQPNTPTPTLSDETISFIKRIGQQLPHRSLQGHQAQSIEALLALSPGEVDLSRALVLLDDPKAPPITAVEATLDILALEILSRIGPSASNDQKISAINHLLFEELSVRFPPETEASQKTEQFSDLSSVLFSRRGICLGASVLYLSLAQRVALPLTIYTPPGHIFVAYKTPSETRVIETTARGIEIPIDQYLGLTFSSLPERTMKEVIGMVLFNRAADHLKRKEWKEALSLYHQAESFEQDTELSLMMSLCELLIGESRHAQARAKEALKSLPKYRLEPDVLLLDMAEGTISKEAAEQIILLSDVEGDQLLPAINTLKALTPKNPKSYSIPLHLAYSWLCYGKPKEALPIIDSLSKRSDAPCSIYVLLAELHYMRQNLPATWHDISMACLRARQHGNIVPKPLRDFILELHEESPSCEEVKNLLYPI